MFSTLERKILKHCLNTPSDMCMNGKQLSSVLNVDLCNIRLAIENLLENGYFQDAAHTEDGNIFFSHNFRSLEYKHNRRWEIVKIILGSIVIPIAVSVATTMITSKLL